MIYFSITFLKKMEGFNIIIMIFLVPFTRAILVQDHDDQGNVKWRAGSYRNRDVIPIPPSYDADKKHKRDVKIEDSDHDMTTSNDVEYDESADIKAQPSKKSFIRTHFALPLGAEIPFGYSEPVQPKGKKSSVPHSSLEDKLADSSKYNILNLDRDAPESGRSAVPKSWGLTWKDPDPKLNRDSKGYGRSKLEGLTSGRISEEDFDSGLMGRGLGGLKERAQNENLMEKIFADKIDDENDVDTEDSRRRKKRFIFFLPHIHHHHVHHQHYPRRRYNQNGRHPNHPQAVFPSAHDNSSTNKNDTEKVNSESIVENNGSNITNAAQHMGETVSTVITMQNTSSFDKASSALPQQSLYIQPPSASSEATNTTVGDRSNATYETDNHQRQFKQTKEGQVSGAQGGDSLSGKENNHYEYQPQFGDKPDGEYDKQYPNGIDGLPSQYQNHDPHHNVYNEHLHSPYTMHQPHDDYKNIHPAHPYEEKMKDIVSSGFNFTNPLLEKNPPSFKRNEIVTPSKNNKLTNFRAMLRHFLLHGGKIQGRHRDEDLSPAEIIV